MIDLRSLFGISEANSDQLERLRLLGHLFDQALALLGALLISKLLQLEHILVIGRRRAVFEDVRKRFL